MALGSASIGLETGGTDTFLSLSDLSCVITVYPVPDKNSPPKTVIFQKGEYTKPMGFDGWFFQRGEYTKPMDFRTFFIASKN